MIMMEDKDMVNVGMMLLLQVVVKQQDTEECHKEQNGSSKLQHQQNSLQ